MTESIHILNDLPVPAPGAPLPRVVAVEVRFSGTYAVRWGPPNDEKRAELRAAEQHDWIAGLRHFCIPFHDSTLDVIADGYTYETRYAPLHEVLLTR